MTLRSYLLGVRVSTFFALSGWILVVNYINPEEAGIAGQLLFYSSTFLFLSCLFILLFTWIGRRTGEQGEIIENLGIGFRQGVLLAIMAIILLFMQSMRILVWWDGLLVIAGIFLIELYFLSHKK